MLIKLAPRTILQNQINPLIIKKVPVQPQNINMPQMTLNLNLPPELMLHSGFEELSFLEDFEGDDVFGVFFAGKVDGAEFTATERLADFEVGEGPLAAGLGEGGVGGGFVEVGGVGLGGGGVGLVGGGEGGTEGWGGR